MEPTRPQNATLVDLLDRLLEKGLLIQADLIVSLAGIPLIGVNLRAAIAGMETMLEYGFLREWDAAIRAREAPAADCDLGPRIPVCPPARLRVSEGPVTRQARARALCVNGEAPSWKRGLLLLTDSGLSWRASEGASGTTVIPLPDIIGCLEEEDGIVHVVYRQAGNRRVASFAGEEVREVLRAIERPLMTLQV